MKIIPAKNRLLLEELKPDDMPHSGIALAQSAQVGSTTAYRIVATADYIDEDQEIYLRGSIIFVAPGKGIPVCFGSAYGVLQNLHTFDKVSVRQGALGVSPSYFPSTVLNAPACHASIRHRLTGPLYNFSNGAASGLDALGYHISSGDAF